MTRITKHYRTAAVPCPICFSRLDSAASFDSDNPPMPGDFTVCLECSSVLRYDDVMGVVASSLAEAPIDIRARLATVKMLTEEFKHSEKKGAKPWEM